MDHSVSTSASSWQFHLLLRAEELPAGYFSAEHSHFTYFWNKTPTIKYWLLQQLKYLL